MGLAFSPLFSAEASICWDETVSASPIAAPTPLPFSHLMVELLYAVDFHFFGSRNQPHSRPTTIRSEMFLIDHRHARTVSCALVEEAPILFVRLQEDDNDRYRGEPHGEHVLLDRAEATKL